MIYHIFIFVVNITPMLLAHGNKFKSVNSNSLKDRVEINRYGDMTIKSTGSTMSFQVNWKGRLHKLVYNTNDALIIKTSEDGGQTWTTKRTL